MQRIASQLRSRQKEAGFSLTELIAGLLVASLLIVGLIDVTRRFARTTDNVRETTGDLRTDIMLNSLFSDLERIDPHSLELTPRELRARLGGVPIVARIEESFNGTILHWTAPATTQALVVPKGTRFVSSPYGGVVLRQTETGIPLAVATPQRNLPFDCLSIPAASGCEE